MLSTLKSSLKASVINLILLLLLVEVSYAHRNPGYSHDGGRQANNPRWMTDLKDNVLLSELSIPGTHDTMSFYGGDAVQTQGMSLPNQLISGIRVLDIRCRNSRNTFPIYHGHVKNRVGTIMSDFPGPGLSDRIIALNNRFRK
jgi:1-phosphatidylinositol phosphodiesterase